MMKYHARGTCGSCKREVGRYTNKTGALQVICPDCGSDVILDRVTNTEESK